MNNLARYNDTFAVVETTDGDYWPGTLAADDAVVWVYSGHRGHPKVLHADEVSDIWLWPEMRAFVDGAVGERPPVR